MKKILFSTLVLLLVASFASAQISNMVIFSEGGERFTAIVNGIRMNDYPATNVKVTDLNQPGYKLKVIFEDTRLGEVNKDVMVAAGEETVYMVKLDKKGGYKVAWRSSTPIAQAPPAPATQAVFVWGAPAVVTPAPAPAPVPVSTGTTVIVEETVTTTTTGGTVQPTTTGENVNMNVAVPGFGMNVNINTNETGMNTNTVVSGTSTTTTTTTTTTTSGGTYVQPAPQPVIVPQPVATAAPCAMMDYSSFNAAKNSIKAKSFEDSKMTMAKQITKSNCLSAGQVKEIMELFSFEASKLDYAKFAWHYCYEQNNYFQVNDVFDFESSIEDLDKYINTQR